MSKNSEAVKLWRKNTKERLVKALGGECVVCGYSKLPDALDLHHLDPSEKDFSFGGARATPVSWKRLVSEAKKCVLVCCRCHREVHSGISSLPDDFPSFDPSYEEYKEVAEQHPCRLCGGPTSKPNIYCSLRCSGKASALVDWDSVDLKFMYGIMTVVAIAEKLGVSDAAVHKRLKKLGLK